MCIQTSPAAKEKEREREFDLEREEGQERKKFDR